MGDVPAAPAYGTPKQQDYLLRLSKELGFANIPSALAELTEIPVKTAGLSVDAASAAIEQLKAIAATIKPASPRSEGEEPRRRFLTARHLRQIDNGERERPDPLDDDAQWVLERLEMVRKVEGIFPDRPQSRLPASKGVNRGGPIRVDDLLAFFKDWDRLADAFEVAVPTAKAWGTHLPAARAWEAQIKTKGYVTA